MDKLLNLRADARVLEMLLQRRRVVLGLLQNALHDGVLEDADDLMIMSVVVSPIELEMNIPLGLAGCVPLSAARSRPHVQSTELVGPWSPAAGSHECSYRRRAP